MVRAARGKWALSNVAFRGFVLLDAVVGRCQPAAESVDGTSLGTCSSIDAARRVSA